MDVALSINIQRSNGEVIPVSVPSGSTTTDLKHLLAARLNKPAAEFSFSFNGGPLADDAVLMDAGIRTGAVVQVEELEQSIRTLLAPDDFTCGLLVQGLPAGDPQETEDKIVSHFSTFGQISRIIIQQDESQNVQHAVIIFGSTAELLAAVAVEDHSVLGANIAVRALEQIDEITEPQPSRYAEFLGQVLARGYMWGRRGAMRVLDFDKKHQISQRTLESAQVIDEKWGLTARVLAFTDSLEKRLHLSEVAQQTSELAKRTLENSLQNRYVAAGVERATEVLQSAKAFGMETLGAAQRELEHAQVAADATSVELLPQAVDESKQEMTA